MDFCQSVDHFQDYSTLITNYVECSTQLLCEMVALRGDNGASLRGVYAQFATDSKLPQCSAEYHFSI